MFLSMYVINDYLAIPIQSLNDAHQQITVLELATFIFTHLSFMKCLILTMAFSSIFLRKVFNLSLLFSSILPSASGGRFVLQPRFTPNSAVPV